MNEDEKSRMKNNVKYELSSSEDESNLEALKEAADQNFLKNSFFNKEEKQTEEKHEDNKTDDVIDNNEPEELQLFHGISQSCKDFIAKKLHERLNLNLVFEEKIEAHKKEIDPTVKTGIKLLHDSNFFLTEPEEVNEYENTPKKRRKKLKEVFNEKKNLLKCKEVVITSESVLSQKDTNYWTMRKPGKEFKYKKLKNGTLKEIKQ